METIYGGSIPPTTSKNIFKIMKGLYTKQEIQDLCNHINKDNTSALKYRGTGYSKDYYTCTICNELISV